MSHQRTAREQMIYDRIVSQGRHAWSVLHGKLDPSESWYYRQWVPLIPSFGCNCNAQWSEITKNFPPDFRNPVKFHWWAINAHNLVNEKLGKPTWPNCESAITPAVASLLLRRTVLGTLPAKVVHALRTTAFLIPTAGENSASGN